MLDYIRALAVTTRARIKVDYTPSPRAGAKQFVAVLAVLVVVGSTIPLPVAATGAPDGMVGVPDAAVTDGRPAHAQGNGPGGVPGPAAFRGSVMTTHGADSLQVDVTTKAATKGRANACQNPGKATPPHCENPEIALNLTDDVNHEGRRVAIPAAPIVENLGHEPGLAYVEHESGNTYSVPVERQGNLLVFRVENFSTNTITWSGLFTIDAQPAQDGSTFTYEQDSTSGLGNYSINVTGNVAEETDTETGSVTDSASPAVAVAGDLSPTGPASGSPRLNVTGAANDSEITGFVGSDANAQSFSRTFNDPPARLDEVTITKLHNYRTDFYIEVDVKISDDSNTWLGCDNARLSGGDYKTLNCGIGEQNVSGSVTVTVDVVFKQASDDRVMWGTSSDNKGSMTLHDVGPTDVTATAGAQTLDFGAVKDGATKSKSLSLSTGSNTISWSGNGTWDYSVEYTERQQSVKPAIEVNSNWANSTQTLSAGQTESLTANTAWVQEGTNRVNVTFDTTLSADAPTMEVDLDYRHDGQDMESVTYQAEQWTERYDISKTYAQDTNANVTIPFQGSVVAIRDLQKSVNDGAWASVPASNYTLSGTTLDVDLGSVSKTDKVEVRVNGSKVNAHNASLQVQEVTTEGQSLNSKIKLSTWNSDSYIEVGGTENGNEIHYAASESWSGADDHSRFDSAGNQYLNLPNAKAGGTFRVKTLPVEAAPQTGDVSIKVGTVDADEPEFTVSEGTTAGDAVDYTFLDAQSGEEYILYSKTNSIVRDGPKEASSPLTLSDDDSPETLVFQLDEDSSSAGGGGGGGGGPGPIPTGDSPLNSVPVVLVVSLGAIVAVFAYDSRVKRSGALSVTVPIIGRTLTLPGNSWLVWIVTPIAAFVALDTASDGQLSAALNTVIEQAGNAGAPLFGVGAATLALYAGYKLLSGDLFGGGKSRTQVVIEGVRKRR